MKIQSGSKPGLYARKFGGRPQVSAHDNQTQREKAEPCNGLINWDFTGTPEHILGWGDTKTNWQTFMVVFPLLSLVPQH